MFQAHDCDQADPAADGWTAAEIFSRGTCLTYDEVILMPGYISFPVDRVDLLTKVSKNLTIRAPVVKTFPLIVYYHYDSGRGALRFGL